MGKSMLFIMNETKGDKMNITKEIFEVLKNNVNFAILNLINVEGKISLSDLDIKLKQPSTINDNLNKLIDFELITPIFERRSPIDVFFKVGDAGNVVLNSLEIDKKKSRRFFESYHLGDNKNKLKELFLI